MYLNEFSRVQLAKLPTPLQYAQRLSGRLSGPHVWFKRDDLTGLGLGGNKLRKLEYILAEALDEGADSIITTGGTQSNHARLTAAAARKLGLTPVLVLRGNEPKFSDGNLLVDKLLGAQLHFVEGKPDEIPGEEVEIAMEKVASELREQTKTPYIIPLGGSIPTGVLGYVGCALELADQTWRRGIPVDHVFVASGSGGTVAGLALGLWLLGAGATVHAVSVGPEADELFDIIEGLIAQTGELLGVDTGDAAETVVVHDQFVGDGYGAVTAGCIDAVKLFAQQEGIVVDTVYTGKAANAVVELTQEGRLTKGEQVVFLHTGGSAGLFPKAGVLQEWL